MSRRSTSAPSDNSPVSLDVARAALMPSYRQAPVVLERGEGMYVWDEEGRRYLDFVGGIAVTSVGHSHPAVVDAITEQARTLVHTSALWFNRPAMELAAALQARSGFGARVFLSNSGAEANEAAIKLARRYFRTVKSEDRWRFVTANESFHGRTLAMTAATGQPKYQAGYEPLPEGFSAVPYGHISALADAVGPQTAAVILEPIQGEGGIRMPPPGYLKQVREVCDQKGALLILDEIQTGVGRTGTFFAFEQSGAIPHIVTLAKGLAGGVPIGATLAHPDVAEGFQPGAHASTFGGGPLACQAALAVLGVLNRERLLDNARAMGEYLQDKLGELAEDDRLRGAVINVRGLGLMVGLELAPEVDAIQVVGGCRNRALLVNTAGQNTLRFVPPLIVERGHVRAAADCLREVLFELVKTR